MRTLDRTRGALGAFGILGITKTAKATKTMKTTKTTRTKLPAHHQREHGNIAVVTIGFLTIIGLIVVLVINASAVFLEHRKLVNVADSIALRAADSVDVSYYLSHRDLDRLTIDEAAARAEARARLDSETHFDMRVTNDTVFVRLERLVELWAIPGWQPRTRVVAEAQAQLTVIDSSSPSP